MDNIHRMIQQSGQLQIRSRGSVSLPGDLSTTNPKNESPIKPISDEEVSQTPKKPETGPNISDVSTTSRLRSPPKPPRTFEYDSDLARSLEEAGSGSEGKLDVSGANRMIMEEIEKIDVAKKQKEKEEAARGVPESASSVYIKAILERSRQKAETKRRVEV